MKKILIISLAAAVTALFSSCDKNSSQQGAVEKGENAVLNVRISAGGGTKATSASENDEAKVNKIEVLVFNGSGALDAYKSSDGTGLKVEGISSSSGAKTVVAVVNAPSAAGISAVTDIDGLRAITSHFKADNALDSFVMYGEKSVTLQSSGTNNVSVEVSRLAARIRIDKVKRQFRPELQGLVALPADDFEIVRFYLANVADDVNYGAPVSPAANSTWLTDDSAHTANAVQIDKDSKVYSIANTTGGMNKLAQDGVYDNVHRLYAYPNASTSMITKLIVECLIDGNYYTFPIAFEGLQPNYSYEIRNLTITRLGHASDGDDSIDTDEDVDPIQTVDFDCEITVNPWNLVLMGPSGDGNITI